METLPPFCGYIVEHVSKEYLNIAMSMNIASPTAPPHCHESLVNIQTECVKLVSAVKMC